MTIMQRALCLVVLISALAMPLRGNGGFFFHPTGGAVSGGGGGGGGWVLINHAIQGGAGGASTTTPAADFSACVVGSCLIVAAVCDYNGNSLGTFVDSTGLNTWNVAVTHNDAASNFRATLYEAFNPHVTSSMTFKYTSAGGTAAAYASVGVLGFTGALNGIVDQSNFADSASSAVTTLALGSITTATDNEMVFSILCGGATGWQIGTSPVINSGTIRDTPINYNGGATFGLAFSYFALTPPGSLNEQFTWSQAMFAAGVVGSFKP